jgi:hypothetical protein
MSGSRTKDRSILIVSIENCFIKDIDEWLVPKSSMVRRTLRLRISSGSLNASHVLHSRAFDDVELQQMSRYAGQYDGLVDVSEQIFVEGLPRRQVRYH